MAELQARVQSLQRQVQELSERLNQNSTNSSRPPSTDPPQATGRPNALDLADSWSTWMGLKSPESPAKATTSDSVTVLAGSPEPALTELAVRRAEAGLVAVVSAEPWLAPAVAEVAGSTTVLDLAQPW